MLMDVAEAQEEAFGKIMSDEEALILFQEKARSQKEEEGDLES